MTNPKPIQISFESVFLPCSSPANTQWTGYKDVVVFNRQDIKPLVNDEFFGLLKLEFP
jgi:hypothetical protein